MTLSNAIQDLVKERRGEHRIVKEVDDILCLVTFVEENKAITGLPRYATDASDRIPTARLSRVSFSYF